MAEAEPPKPLAFKPRVSDLEKTIRTLAKDSKNVFWGPHTKQRMGERDITDEMMLEVLRTGSINGEIEAGEAAGEWKAKMTKTIKGRRQVGVATIVAGNSKLFVKTVEWEDMR